MSFETLNLLETFLLPPGLLIVLAFIGLLLIRIKFGRKLLFISVLGWYLLSTPYISSRLIAPLESQYPAASLQSLQHHAVQALVLLGGGYYGESIEYADSAIGPFFAERLRYTAWLSRQSKLPVIITSGKSDAHAAARILQTQYGITPIAVEDKSWNTQDNAQNTRQLLKSLGIQNIAVITHGWHMPRAMWSFENDASGIKLLAAPMGLIHSHPKADRLKSWYPYSVSLLRSDRAIHEYVGTYWYQYRHDNTKGAIETEAVSGT
jgi:uncharacterized SAM-binding protein YcdF (DUF218 family)